MREGENKISIRKSYKKPNPLAKHIVCTCGRALCWHKDKKTGEEESDWRIYACALVLNVVFWFLDAYYLMQEKLFRELYDKVSKISDDSLVDFSMNTSEFKEKVSAIPCLMIKSISITPLYLSISAVLLVLIHVV